MATRNFAVLVARGVAHLLIEDARRAKAKGRLTAAKHYVQQARYVMHKALKHGEYGTVTAYIMGR